MEINSQYAELQEISLSNSFSWLNFYLTYLPMFTSTKPNGNQRSKWLIIIFMIINVLTNTFHFAFSAKYAFEDWTDNYVAQTVYVVNELAILFSRYFSIIYYYKYCNYSWVSAINEIQLNHNHTNYYTFQKSNKIIKWGAHLLFITRSIVVTAYCIGFYLSSAWWVLLLVIGGAIFVYFPVYASVVVICFIYIKYCAYLLYMVDTINATDNDFVTILKQYRLLVKSFKVDHNVCLKWSIYAYLLGGITDVWLSVFDLFQHKEPFFVKTADISSNIADTLFALLFVYGACLMNETFQKFQTQLYESGKQFVDDRAVNDDYWNSNYHSYNYLLHYSSKYPLTIRIGRITVTKGTTIKFVITFAIVRWLSYSVHYFY
eukprot:405270_1